MFNFFKKAEQAATQNETTEVSSAPIEFTDVRAKWKALSAAREITKEDAAALSVYRALMKSDGVAGALRRLQKSFKPITNKVKLENGAYPNGAVQEALRMAKYSKFSTWLPQEQFDQLMALSKETLKEIK